MYIIQQCLGVFLLLLNLNLLIAIYRVLCHSLIGCSVVTFILGLDSLGIKNGQKIDVCETHVLTKKLKYSAQFTRYFGQDKAAFMRLLGRDKQCKTSKQTAPSSIPAKYPFKNCSIPVQISNKKFVSWLSHLIKTVPPRPSYLIKTVQSQQRYILNVSLDFPLKVTIMWPHIVETM